MNTAVILQEVKIKNIQIPEDTITAQLVDGRTISGSVGVVVAAFGGDIEAAGALLRFWSSRRHMRCMD